MFLKSADRGKIRPHDTNDAPKHPCNTADRSPKRTARPDPGLYTRGMIYDLVSGLHHYQGVLPALPAALEAMGKIDLAQQPNGRQTLVFGDADLILDRYVPSPDRPVVWETHRLYADVQIMLEGEERFGWLPASAAPPVKTPYDSGRDACFYHPPAEGHSPTPQFLPLVPGRFALFLPGDLHAPGLCPDGVAPTAVTKAVLKVRAGPR